ncbi:hypothetical protein RvVAR0630_pl02040 (plasmid) [Agrobacterium vitis]|nr:hypothetical protein RvVAR0630_pl02040 [Agrobacterium vitis]
MFCLRRMEWPAVIFKDNRGCRIGGLRGERKAMPDCPLKGAKHVQKVVGTENSGDPSIPRDMQPTIDSVSSPRGRNGNGNGARIKASKEGGDEGEARRIDHENTCAGDDKSCLRNLLTNTPRPIAKHAPGPGIRPRLRRSDRVIMKEAHGNIIRHIPSTMLKHMNYRYKFY